MARLRGTDVHALGIRAMLASYGQEVHFHIGALRAFVFRIGANAQHLVPKRANRHAIGGFACDAAAQAANAAIEVGNYRVMHQ